MSFILFNFGANAKQTFTRWPYSHRTKQREMELNGRKRVQWVKWARDVRYRWYIICTQNLKQRHHIFGFFFGPPQQYATPSSSILLHPPPSSTTLLRPPPSSPSPVHCHHPRDITNQTQNVENMCNMCTNVFRFAKSGHSRRTQRQHK